MANKKNIPAQAQIYESELLDAIIKNKFMRFDHCFGGSVTFSRATAYNHGLDKLDSIKDALESNRLKGVNYLLQKWITGENATLQIAAMRLICTPEEHRLLNQQYTENKTTIVSDRKFEVEIIDATKPADEVPNT